MRNVIGSVSTFLATSVKHFTARDRITTHLKTFDKNTEKLAPDANDGVVEHVDRGCV